MSKWGINAASNICRLNLFFNTNNNINLKKMNKFKDFATVFIPFMLFVYGAFVVYALLFCKAKPTTPPVIEQGRDCDKKGDHLKWSFLVVSAMILVCIIYNILFEWV